MTAFKTHKGDIIEGDKLKEACEIEAQWIEANAKSVYESDNYASHVTEQEKLDALHRRYDLAQSVREMKGLNNFTIWQRINTRLTGECIALLKKTIDTLIKPYIMNI